MQKENLIAFVYIFVRLAPITLIAPIFFLRYIPLLIRTLMTVALAIVISLSLHAHSSSLETEISFKTLISEIVLGLILSLGFHAVNAGLHMMSQLIDVQMGLSAGATFDPVNYQTSTPTGTLFAMVATAIFLGSNLHYDFFYILRELFTVIPPGKEFTVGSDYFFSVSKLFIASFILAGPVICALFLTDVALALVSRSMPQAQIYFVTLPLKIMIGFLILALTISLSQKFFYELLFNALLTWDYVKIN